MRERLGGIGRAVRPEFRTYAIGSVTSWISFFTYAAIDGRVCSVSGS